MREISGINALMQGDEMVVNDEIQIIELHEVVEMVQMVDKWLFHMRACMSSDALMCVVVAVDDVEE